MKKEIILVEELTSEEIAEIENSKTVKLGYSSLEEYENSIKEDSKIQERTTWIDVVHLHKHMTSWAIYRPGVAPVTGNQFAYLKPSQFGGLTYTGYYQGGGVYVINTEQYGSVQIWCPDDEDSCKTSVIAGSAEHFLLTKSVEGQWHVTYNTGVGCKFRYAKH